MDELPIIQKSYDLIKWYAPILNRLPRDQKFALGDRITAGLYDLLEGLILARYARERINRLMIRTYAVGMKCCRNTHAVSVCLRAAPLLRAGFCINCVSPMMLNGRLDVLRHQTRLLLDFALINPERYHHAAKLINEIGVELGGWLKQQKQRRET